ncbi:class I SAM-dependent methyltransferase [Cytophagaceae bacterium YF14B1]|uniref:Class I SAM-dependent methyltransferase n=1 Tax=Xanthocytophaga flava TaxID=3048013 RepID=A0AAE3U881_9BACT|nr:class I SAM-dependent methyltransferase [Xanthocytophaga flavus]MDJ1482402.1 class I SAM-dependent methyltransferase [Xanthocytophaga flavus]
MTWEETIIYIRTLPEYQNLIHDAYLDEDLLKNVNRFKNSEEYKATLSFIKQFSPQATKLLDIGAGNGISSIAFALDKFNVTAVEPDSSITVGSNAIRYVSDYYTLVNIQVIESYAEKLPFPDATFDIVYARQAMHHAQNLDLFVSEAFRVLKKGGIFFTVRDHVIHNNKEKIDFLASHPLQKFYGGENAFSITQYKNAFEKCGFEILITLSHFDSVINFAPKTEQEILATDTNLKDTFNKKFPFMSKFLFPLYKFYISARYGKINDESNMPGRLYSFIAQKN